MGWKDDTTGFRKQRTERGSDRLDAGLDLRGLGLVFILQHYTKSHSTVVMVDFQMLLRDNMRVLIETNLRTPSSAFVDGIASCDIRIATSTKSDLMVNWLQSEALGVSHG